MSSLIDALSNALHFSNVATQKVSKNKKQEKTNSTQEDFDTMVDNEKRLKAFEEVGLPKELASMSCDEAIVVLKDAIDASGDKLEENFIAENFAAFKKSVSQFLKYMEHANYSVETVARVGKSAKEHVYSGASPFFFELRKPAPYETVKVINQRLDEIATMILQNHSDKLLLLEKVGEIKGLIVDFLAG